MTKVLIYGGLGNQMFQYALNSVINEKGNKSQIVFTNFFYNFHHNGFNLSFAFKLKLPFPLNLYNFILSYGGSLYKNKFSTYVLERLIKQHHRKNYILYKEDKEFVYDETVFLIKSGLLVGTWQVEEYFKNHEEIIKHEFVFNKPRDKKNKELIEEINACNSVSVHVRRGDYLSNNWAKTHKVIKDNTYYINSINYLKEKIENPIFYIFSDDISWAKENFSFCNCIFVDHNKDKNTYVDMYLMSLCKHNIIANSTFSWWGAWLNKNENKIVIIPARWLNTESCLGIYPSKWIKMGI